MAITAPWLLPELAAVPEAHVSGAQCEPLASMELAYVRMATAEEAVLLSSSPDPLWTQLRRCVEAGLCAVFVGEWTFHLAMGTLSLLGSHLRDERARAAGAWASPSLCAKSRWLAKLAPRLGISGSPGPADACRPRTWASLVCALGSRGVPEAPKEKRAHVPIACRDLG